MNLDEQMRLRFHAAMQEHEALKQSIAHLRVEYEALAVQSSEIAAKQKALALQFLPVEHQMSDLSNEAARLARALNGKTGEA